MTKRIAASSTNIFVLILLLGFILRAAALMVFGPYDTHAADPYNYVQLAKSVVAGDGLTFDDPVYGAGLRAFYPPVYPLVLAAFGSIAGFSGPAFIAMNGLTDAATAFILRRYDVRAAAIYFLWPWNVLGSFLAQKESLLCLLVVVLGHIAIQNRKMLGPRPAAVFGLFAGLTMLTQPGLVLFPIILAAAFFFRSESRLRAASTAAACAALVLLPWWIRNWLAFHRFVPLTTAAGVSLAYVVNYGHFPPPDNVSALPEPERFRRMGALAIAHIQSHLGAYLRALLEQVYNTIFAEKFALSRVAHGDPFTLLSRLLASANIALLGVAALSRNKDYWRLMLVCVLSLVPMIWLELAERHRYFMLPVIALLAADATRNMSALMRRTQGP